MKIQILISKNSWAVKYKNLIKKNLNKYSSNIIFLSDHTKLKNNYDINIIFSYFKIIKNKYLIKSKYNLVPHESDLPKGRGMSPLTWQIIKGKEIITFSLFEASEKLDEGPIYLKKKIRIKKHLTFKEIKNIQFNINISLINIFLEHYKKRSKPLKSFLPKGIPSYFRGRKPKDSKIDINKSLKTQFDLLRVCDDKNYPAFFFKDKKKYFLKLTKAK